MKRWIALVCCLISVTCALAELSPDPDAQAQALAKYPALAQEGSPFNKAFVEKVRVARDTKAQIMNDPRWPLLIAEAVAQELGTKPVTAKLTPPDAGLQKFVKMTVEQVAASPFSLEGVMVELGGIDRVELQEVEKGKCEVTIHSKAGISYLVGELPKAQALAAERSRTLFVSISEPRKDGSRIHIHGNSAAYAGLSTVPTVSWSSR